MPLDLATAGSGWVVDETHKWGKRRCVGALGVGRRWATTWLRKLAGWRGAGSPAAHSGQPLSLRRAYHEVGCRQRTVRLTAWARVGRRVRYGTRTRWRVHHDGRCGADRRRAGAAGTPVEDRACQPDCAVPARSGGRPRSPGLLSDRAAVSAVEPPTWAGGPPTCQASPVGPLWPSRRVPSVAQPRAVPGDQPGRDRVGPGCSEGACQVNDVRNIEESCCRYR